MTDTALRVLLQIDIKPGNEQDFEVLWRRHANFISQHSDNLGQWLLRRTDSDTESDTDSGSGYVVLTDWTDEPAFRAFEQSDEQQEYLKRLWPMRAGGSMILLTTLHHFPQLVQVTE